MEADNESPRKRDAIMSWYRLVVGHGDRLQHRLAQGDFLLEQLARIGKRFLPRIWPHQRRPVSQSTHADIVKYWEASDPRLYEQWKTVFQYAIEWIDRTEVSVRGDLVTALQFGLVQECAASSGLDTVPLTVTTLGIFLLKKSILQNTTVRLMGQVKGSRVSFARLVEELYGMVRLYEGIYPVLVQRREVALRSAWNWA